MSPVLLNPHRFGGAAPGGGSYFDEVMADSPRAYYRLGEASGPTMVDSSGNGRNGTYGANVVLGTAGATPGNTAITTSGASTGVGDVAYAAWMDVTNAVSMEAWVKHTYTTGTRFFFGRKGWSASPCGLYLASGKISFLINGPSVVTANSPTASNDNLWHHAVGTFDGTTIRIYVDGAEVDTSPLSGSADITAHGLHVGGREGDYYAGPADECAYYGSVLSPARIAAHYAARNAA